MNNRNRMSLDLKDYIFIIDDFLDKEFCKKIVKKISKLDWLKHSYTGGSIDIGHSYDNDLSVLFHAQMEERYIIEEKLKFAYRRYIDKLNFPWYRHDSINYTKVRFNRYDMSTEMRKHCDHIVSIWEGGDKGVPVLSFLGILNDNYEGGEFIMFDDYKLDLKAGSLVVFPSNFLFPHRVNSITKGTRYSYVSWGW